MPVTESLSQSDGLAWNLELVLNSEWFMNSASGVPTGKVAD